MKLYSQIKQIVSDMVENTKPKVVYGVVTSISPLIVTVEQRLPLPAEALIIGEKMMSDFFRGDSIIIEKLKKGDNLIIFKIDGEYVVFDKVGVSQ